MNATTYTHISEAVSSSKQLKKQSKELTGIEVYQKYGITKKQLASLMINIFHFPHQYRDCLSQYYLLHWAGEHFSNTIEEGTIKLSTDPENATEYLVVYQGCTPYQAKKAKQLRLSFRKPQNDFQLQAYVIVRILVDTDGNGD